MSKRGKEMIALLGISLVLSGTMIGCAGCKAGLDTPIKESVTQTEVIDSENKIESMDELALNQVIPTPTQNVSIPEKEVQDEGIKEEFESLDTKTNITFKDGIYGFTEKFINSVSSYEYFEGATQKEINDFLQELAPVIDGLEGKDVDAVLSIYVGNLHAQNQAKAEASKPTPTPEAEKPVAEQKPTEQKQEPTPVIKEEIGVFDGGFDDLIVNEDGTRTSPDGTFTFDAPIGGGPHTELPEGFLGFNSGGHTEKVQKGPTVIIRPNDSDDSDENLEELESASEWELDPEIWGNADTTPVGGGGQAELPEGFQGINSGGQTKPVVTPTPVIKEPANENDYSWFDDLIVNEDGTRTSSDGTFTFDDPDSFGGGGQAELPEGFLGFH